MNFQNWNKLGTGFMNDRLFFGPVMQCYKYINKCIYLFTCIFCETIKFKMWETWTLDFWGRDLEKKKQTDQEREREKDRERTPKLRVQAFNSLLKKLWWLAALTAGSLVPVSCFFHMHAEEFRPDFKNWAYTYRKTNITQCQLHVESKKVELIEVDSSKMIIRGCQRKVAGEMLVKGYRFFS